jgi:hypothetical protein
MASILTATTIVSASIAAGNIAASFSHASLS